MSPPIRTPDGNEVSEIVLPDGSTASEVIGPSGNVVFEAGPDIPDAIVAQYFAEDTGDTTIAIDDVGTNDISLSGVSYNTTNPLCGSASLDFDASSDNGVSQNGVDIASNGVNGEFGIGCYINANDGGNNNTFLNWGVDGSNLFDLRYKKGDSIEATLAVNGSFAFNELGGDISVPTHVWANVDQSQIELFLDNSSIGTISHSLDITNIGSGNYNLGQRSDGSQEWAAGGLLDNITFAAAKLSQSERQTLIDQC